MSQSVVFKLLNYLYVTDETDMIFTQRYTAKTSSLRNLWISDVVSHFTVWSFSSIDFIHTMGGSCYFHKHRRKKNRLISVSNQNISIFKGRLFILKLSNWYPSNIWYIFFSFLNALNSPKGIGVHKFFSESSRDVFWQSLFFFSWLGNS